MMIMMPVLSDDQCDCDDREDDDSCNYVLHDQSLSPSSSYISRFFSFTTACSLRTSASRSAILFCSRDISLIALSLPFSDATTIPLRNSIVSL